MIITKLNEVEIMERLLIKKFLILEDIDLEVKKLNIIIGSQATGKSLIAKLLYFFQTVSKELETGIVKQLDISETTNNISEKFEKIFPRYTWEGTSFQLKYCIDDFCIEIKNTYSLDKPAHNFEILFSDNLLNAYRTLTGNLLKMITKAEKNFKNEKEAIELQFTNPFRLRHYTRNQIQKSEIKNLFMNSNARFIPASRSFFSIIKDNIFTLLSSNQNLDPLLIDFGKLYESFKSFYNSSVSNSKDNEINQSIRKLMEIVLNGKYHYEDEKDWIIKNHKKIDIVNASSGQQEALPMLLMLGVLSHIENKDMLFIEEPEAHLFPVSQGHIVSLISTIYDQGQRFFITTHSPYILSELNNFIYASDLISREKLTIDDFKRINEFGLPINFNDIAAYTIKDGKIESILDTKYKMINSDKLDKASEHAEKVFNALMEYETPE